MLTSMLPINQALFNVRLSHSIIPMLVSPGRFIDYEMVLNVRFRDEGGLTELSGHKHSGGERAGECVMIRCGANIKCDF